MNKLNKTNAKLKPKAGQTKDTREKNLEAMQKELDKCKNAETVLLDMIARSPISIQIVDKDGYTISVNDAHTRFFGMKPPAKYSVFNDQQLQNQGLASGFKKLQKGEMVFFPDTCYNVKNINHNFPDKTVWVKTLGFPIFDIKGNSRRFIIMHEDITQRKQTEEELKTLNNSLRELSNHLQNVREREREEISREIHDELGQMLTSIKIDLGLLSNKISDRQLHHEILEMFGKIDKTIISVQEIFKRLKPETMEWDMALSNIYNSIDEACLKTGIEIKTSINAGLNIECHKAYHICKIVQELLTNIIRHAGASKVMIALGETNHQLMLTVTDNGKGITQKQIASLKSQGIAGIKQRVAMMGGTLSITGDKTKGSKTKIIIPL